MRSRTSVPKKGEFPESRTKSRQPNAQRSIFSSHVSDVKDSGAVYKKVPTWAFILAPHRPLRSLIPRWLEPSPGETVAASAAQADLGAGPRFDQQKCRPKKGAHAHKARKFGRCSVFPAPLLAAKPISEGPTRSDAPGRDLRDRLLLNLRTAPTSGAYENREAS